MKSIIQKHLASISGDMPNIKAPVMSESLLWQTEKELEGYKLQVHALNKYARIVDPENFRIAWGSYDAMLEKFDMLINMDELEAGDIIGVKRLGGLYSHYAVYIGNDEVIHYAGRGDDFGGEISIHQAPISEFLNDSTAFFILDFPDKYGIPSKSNSAVAADYSQNEIRNVINSQAYHLYSPQETIERAKSRLGETEYSLVFNNCEHFAIWCKTGISESHQVNALLNVIVPLQISSI